MKNRTVVWLLSGILCLNALIGCGKKEETPEEAVPTEEAPTATPEPTEEPTPEPTEEPTATPEPTVEETSQPTVVAPEGYDAYTYGHAPLSSVYILLRYAEEFSTEQPTLADLGLEGIPAEEFMAKLDEMQEIPADATEEEKEEARGMYLILVLGFSGLSDGSEEQKEGFFAGTWVPDGTDYMAEYRQEDGSIHIGGDSSTGYTNGRINGNDYAVTCSANSQARELTFQLGPIEEGAEFIPLSVDGFTVEYNGLEGFTITDAVVSNTETGQNVVISYSGTPDDVENHLGLVGTEAGSVYWIGEIQ